mgnify:CR=1 FL=1
MLLLLGGRLNCLTPVPRVLCWCRYPFPDAWPKHSNNYMRVAVRKDSQEWAHAAKLLRNSIADATLVSVHRYACTCFDGFSVRTGSSCAQLSAVCCAVSYGALQRPEPIPVEALHAREEAFT